MAAAMALLMNACVEEQIEKVQKWFNKASQNTLSSYEHISPKQAC